MRLAFVILLSNCLVSSAVAEDLEHLLERKFTATDTLDVNGETGEDARACLDGLCWPPGEFVVSCQPARDNRGDLLVRFPSPIESGDARNDLVSMEWYVARNEQGQPVEAPAIVVVHESGRGMQVGRLFANGLRQRGVHTFLIHLPSYGERREGRDRPEASQLFTLIRQAIADVRRARDAVAVLPWVQGRHVALQGTSLGGFVSATVAGLDHGYDSIFVMLAGGDLFDIIQKGERDTAKVREELQKAGLAPEVVKDLVWAIEPNRIAHRVNRERTWLYSGDQDNVVPIKNALSWAKAARLDVTHHIRMPANHYSGILFLPIMQDHVIDQVKAGAQVKAAADGQP